MDRGTLAKIDRKLLAGLSGEEALRTLRVPATGMMWSTWKRYCDSVGVSMGRAVMMLIDRELISVFGEHTAGELLVFMQKASEQLAVRRSRIEAREREVDADKEQMREWGERLRRRETELDAREQLVESVSKRTSGRPTGRVKSGATNDVPAGQVSSTSAATVCLAAGYAWRLHDIVTALQAMVRRSVGLDVTYGRVP